jgi:hypothetical protein
MADAKAALVKKYRATAQFKEALGVIVSAGIIASAPGRRAECEREVAAALGEVKDAAKIKSIRTPAQYREDLEKLATTLRRAINLAPKAFPIEYQIRRDNDKVSWIRGEDLKTPS